MKVRREGKKTPSFGDLINTYNNIKKKCLVPQVDNKDEESDTEYLSLLESAE